MLQKFRTITLCLLTVFTLHSVAQGNGPIFNEWFEDATLRMDYVLTGHSKQTHVALDDPTGPDAEAISTTTCSKATAD